MFWSKGFLSFFYSQRWLTPNKYRHHEFNVCLRHVQHCRITEEPLRFVKTHSYYSKHVMPNMTTCSRWQPKKNTKHVHTSAHNPSLKLVILPSSLGLPGPREASPSEADPRSRRPSAGCSGAGSAGGDAHRSGVAHRDTTPVEQVAVALPNRTSWGGGGGGHPVYEIVHWQMNSIEWEDCVCVILQNNALPRHMGSHTPSSEGSSPFLEGGCC